MLSINMLTYLLTCTEWVPAYIPTIISLISVFVLVCTLCETRKNNRRTLLVQMENHLYQVANSIKFNGEDGNKYGLLEWKVIDKTASSSVQITYHEYKVFIQRVISFSCLLESFVKTNMRSPFNKEQKLLLYSFVKIYADEVISLFQAHNDDKINLKGDINESFEYDESETLSRRKRTPHDIVDCKKPLDRLTNAIKHNKIRLRVRRCT